MNNKEKGNEAFKKGQYEKAISLYREYVLDENEDNKLAYNNMALAYHRQGEYDLAIEACDQAISLDGEYAKAYYRRIMSRKELINQQKADSTLFYKIYQDCQYFQQVCNPAKDCRELEDLKKLGEGYKKQMNITESIPINPIISNTLELQKQNIEVLSISWMQERTRQMHIQQHYEETTRLSQKIKVTRKEVNDQYKVLNKETNEGSSQQTEVQKSIQLKNLEKKKYLAATAQTDKPQSRVEKQNEMTELKNQTQQAILPEPKQQNLNNCTEVDTTSFQQQSLITKAEQQIKMVKDENETTQICDKNENSQAEILPLVKGENKGESKVEKKEEKQNKQLTNETILTIEQLHQKYFNLEKSRNVFDDFISSTAAILKQKHLPKQVKENLLIYAKQKFKEFKLAIKSMPAAARSDLTQLFLEAGLSQEITNLYTKK